MLRHENTYKKSVVALGESLFYHPAYKVNLMLAKEIRDSSILELAVLLYVFEPDFMVSESTAEKCARWSMLDKFGTPLMYCGFIEPQDLFKCSDYVICPKMDFSKAKFSTKVPGPAKRLLIGPSENLITVISNALTY